jgi:hypothetical protein
MLLLLLLGFVHVLLAVLLIGLITEVIHIDLDNNVLNLDPDIKQYLP